MLRPFLRVLMFCATFLSVQAYAQVLSLMPPPASTCANTPAQLPGDYPINAGRWVDPTRVGPSWDFFFNGYDQLTAYWYGFDSAGRPVWYISGTHTISTDIYGIKTWRAALYQTRMREERPFVVEQIGEIAVRIINEQPDKMAVSWSMIGINNLLPSSDNAIDCLFRRGSNLQSRNEASNVSSNYSGYWYAPNLAGWGYNSLVFPTTANDGTTTWLEENIVAIYDHRATDQELPVWLLARKTSSTGLSPAVTQIPLIYVRNTAASPNRRCTTNCVSETPLVNSYLRRGYNSTGEGQIGVKAYHSAVDQQISFERGIPPNVLHSVKLTNPFGIKASPNVCLAQAGQNTCPVLVEWNTSPPGSWVGAGANARAYKRVIGDNNQLGVRTLLNAALTNNSQFLDPLEVGTRVQYELFDDVSGFSYGLTSEIRAIEPQGVAPVPTPIIAEPPSSFLASDAVGASAGEFRVDEQGNATFSMPIATSAGIAGTRPEISIAYNSSSSGDGELGLGFRLNGISKIYRCRKTTETDGVSSTIYPPINFSETDAYCLDGQRLHNLGPQAGSTTSFEFKSEIDNYQRIIGFDTTPEISGIDSFVVLGKDGSVVRYGSDVGSRLLANIDGVVREPKVVQQWAQASLTDRSNNEISYEYFPDHENGEQLLSLISYNGRENPIFAARASIEFEYELDFLSPGNFRKKLSYLSGSRATTSKYLTRIRSGTRTYKMNYAPARESGGARRLSNITECARNSEAICVKPTTFNWTDENFLYGMSSATENPAHLGAHAAWKVLRIADLDGDGRKEVLTFVDIGNSSTLRVTRLITDRTGAQPELKLDVDNTLSTNIVISERSRWFGTNAVQILDINQDGRDDIMVHNSNNSNAQWLVYTSTGVFTPDGLFTELGTDFQIPIGRRADGEPVIDSQIADFNGDGLPDFLTYHWVNDVIKYQFFIYPMEKTSTALAQQGKPYKFGAARTWKPANECGTVSFRNTKTPKFEAVDFNSDGISDIQLTFDNPSTCTTGESFNIIPSNPTNPEVIAYRAANIDPPRRSVFYVGGGLTSSTGQFTRFAQFDLVTGENLRVVDINGDGVSDLISVHDTFMNYSIGTGIATFNQSSFLPWVFIGANALKDNYEFVDLNQDGGLEVLYESTGIAPTGGGRGDLEIAPSVFKIFSWNGEALVEVTNTPAYGVPPIYQENMARILTDLDGDSNMDGLYMGLEESGSRFKAVVYRGPSVFKAAHRIERITDGLGAMQVIKYAPMTYSTLYRRDQSAPYFRSDLSLGAAGRGSAVFDISSNSYLVQCQRR